MYIQVVPINVAPLPFFAFFPFGRKIQVSAFVIGFGLYIMLHENDADTMREDVLQPLIEELLATMKVVGNIPQLTSAEREQLSNQLALCQVNLSCFEHLLIVQRKLNSLQLQDLQVSVSTTSSIIANIQMFDRKIKEHYDNLNPGDETAADKEVINQ